MHRVGYAVVAAAVVATGCGGFRDLFTSHSNVVARAGGNELSAERAAEILYRAGGPTVNPQAVELIANAWVDLMLLGREIGSGTLSLDSTAADSYLWTEIAQARVQAWHDSVVSRRPVPGPGAPDSVYQAGTVRVFQHILLTPAGATAGDTARARASAQRIQTQARSGANFAALAKEHGTDGSKDDGGFLPPGPRGQFVPDFETPAWALSPGAVSDVIPSQFGFHIIRRPPAGEVQERLRPWIQQQDVRRGDSVYMATLTAQNGLELRTGAAAAVRSAVADPAAAQKSSKQLARFNRGGFTVAEFSRWLGGFTPQLVSQVKTVPDSVLEGFIRTVAQNALLLRQADSAGIVLDPASRGGLRLRLMAEVSQIRQLVGLDTVALADSSTTPRAEKIRLAEAKVAGYFDRLAGGQAGFRPLPPSLSSGLRARGDYKIFQAGLARAQELVTLRKAQDSSAAQAPGLQPAPGPAPVPPPAGDTSKGR